MNASDSFIAARDEILRMPRQLRSTAQDFRWPRLGSFNWACDYFDRLAMHAHPALRVVDDAGADFSLSFGALAARSSQVANFLRGAGVARGDRVLVMLGNVVPLWETMLGIMKLGAVVIPSATLLSSADLADRLQRGEVRAIVTDGTLTTRFAGLAGAPVRISVGACPVGWLDYSAVLSSSILLRGPPPVPSSYCIPRQAIQWGICRLSIGWALSPGTCT